MTRKSMLGRARNHSAEYKAHIQSPEWRRIRRGALERAGFRCQFCGCEKAPGRPLHVHHRSYQNLGAERPEDLTVLCKSCHDAADKQRRLRAGRRPKARRRRRRRLSKPLREIRMVLLIVFAAPAVLKLAAVVLPHLS